VDLPQCNSAAGAIWRTLQLSKGRQLRRLRSSYIGGMKNTVIPLTFAAMFIGSAASAAQQVDIASTTVDYSDLDLGSVKGQAVLRKRIGFAIRRVCSDPGPRSMNAYPEEAACQAVARQSADRGLSQIALRTSPSLSPPSSGPAAVEAFLAPERPH
jgi:UrcA family protein